MEEYLGSQVFTKDSQVVDKLYWIKECSGVYSVKSAYKFLQKQKGEWRQEDSSSLWFKLWRIKAPAKVLNLVWRSLSYCLPTMTMLAQKHVHVLRICPVCQDEDEPIMHALVGCSLASQCWHNILPDVQQDVNGDFARWLEKNLVQWHNFQGRSTQAFVHLKFEGDGAIYWVKPQARQIKVTVDAAIFRDQMWFGTGMVARDERGELLEAKSRLHNGVVSPELAEDMTMKEALSWIKARTWIQVIIEADCLTVVQVIRSKISIESPFGVVIKKCKSIMLELNDISLIFIKRFANMAAHFLAKKSCSHPDRVFDERKVPVELINILLTYMF
ncbi:uncharacterized protein LOC141714499 [Apium graveolens]|uniref:uncharacterized protein LOC141714499 n=1 Tax=Apium graveolens TaxID=4045 RepID=UPI003D7B8F2D